VYHFHDWCSEQLRTYHVGVAEGEAPYYERAVEAVIKGVERDEIPRAQYGALLIDEGHDFEADWLRLVVQMIDPSSNALLLLYDDAQSIYSNRSGLGFSLSSVGIQAKGRTTVLRLNYRNTKQILEFAYRFAKHYINPQDSDDDHIPLIEPQASGNTGPEPFVKRLNSLDEEIDYAIGCIQKWQKAGVALKDIAVLYTTKYQGQKLDKALKNTAISYQWLADKKAKQAYNSEKQDVAVLTIHSSKGLEFQRVILIGAGYLNDADDQLHKNARVLYVGMTRAQEGLVLTTSKQNRYTEVIGV
jgi:superfamily I DNA/RNA helicase